MGLKVRWIVWDDFSAKLWVCFVVLLMGLFRFGVVGLKSVVEDFMGSE